MSSYPSSVRSGVTTCSKSNVPKYQSENFGSAVKTVKTAEETRFARTKSVTRLPSRPLQKPMAPKPSAEHGPSLGTASNERGGTSLSEPIFKSATTSVPPPHARNPFAAYSGEKEDGQSPMPAATGSRSDLKFDPSRAKGTIAQTEFLYSSKSLWFDELQGLIDSAATSRENAAKLKAMNEDLRREVSGLHKTVARLEKKLGDL